VLKKRLVLLSFVLFCLLVLGACRNRHDTDAFYISRADAAKGGEFDRGWSPDFLPESSHAIHIAYDVSPSTVWCAFEFNPADSDKLANNLQRVDPQNIPTSQIPNPNLDWWPAYLTGKLERAKIEDSGLILYRTSRRVSQVQNEDLLIAVDSKGHGFFYGH
jgi:hypothetical protein